MISALGHVRRTFAKAWRYWNNDQAPRAAAAITFYLMLSVSPLLLFVLAVGAIVLRSNGVANELQRHFLDTVRHSIGTPEADFVQHLISESPSRRASYFAGIGGLLVTLYGSSGLLQQLRDSVNAMWKIQGRAGIKALIWKRMIALMMVMALCAILAGWLAFDAVVGYVRRSLEQQTTFPVREFLSFLLACAFWTPVYAAVFKWLPQRPLKWRDVWLGGFVTSLAYALMKYALTLYLSYSKTSESYGSAATVVVILLWAYYSAQIFFFGVEITRANVELHEASTKAT